MVLTVLFVMGAANIDTTWQPDALCSIFNDSLALAGAAAVVVVVLADFRVAAVAAVVVIVVLVD